MVARLLRHLSTSVGFAIATVVAVALTACGSKGIKPLSEGRMVDLLAQMHKAECYMELHGSDFPTDSTRRALRQSVLEQNGVTPEQWDTSLIWYGNHIEKYVDVYDRVIADLENELNDADGGGGTGDVDVALFGDSVDVWPGRRLRLFTYDQPSDMLKFRLRKDNNWEAGDVYTWRFFTPDANAMRLSLSAEYTDGSVDYMNSAIAGTGWHEVKLITDSVKVPATVRGVIMMRPMAGESIYVDSIMLYRTRSRESNYPRTDVDRFIAGYRQPRK